MAQPPSGCCRGLHPQRTLADMSTSVAVARPPATTALTRVLDEIGDAGARALVELNRAHFALRDLEAAADPAACAPPSDHWYRLYEQLVKRALDTPERCPAAHLYTLAAGLLFTETDALEQRAGQLTRHPSRAAVRQCVLDATTAARAVATPLLDQALNRLTDPLQKVIALPARSDDRHGGGTRYLVGTVSYTAEPSTATASAEGPVFLDAELAAARHEAELDELAIRAAAGDRAALDQLLIRIKIPVVRYCRFRMTGRSAGLQTPDDVAQEVLLAVIGALQRYRSGSTHFMAFVRGIIRNKVTDAYRSAGQDRSEPTDEVPDRIVKDDDGPEMAVLRAADRELLATLLSELNDQQREILVLRLGLGHSAEETANLLGTTPGAVRVSQHRALQKLRGLLKGRWIPPATDQVGRIATLGSVRTPSR
jgi:RNA polymerase sigma-70 factor, ECF subfamily